MNRLLLETATDVCSVAVARGDEVVAQRTAEEVHQHASHLTVFIGEVLASAGIAAAELSEIVLSDGPGSYTSLRVGAATAKGLCVALPHLKLTAVPTLHSLAMASPTAGPVLAVINSRRGEVFGQIFLRNSTDAGPRTENQVREKNPSSGLVPPLLRGPQNIRLTKNDWWGEVIRAAGTDELLVCGPGQDRLRDHLPAGVEGVRFGDPVSCAASFLLAPALRRPTENTSANPDGILPAARLVDVAAYEPHYLNPPFVTKSTKKPLL